MSDQRLTALHALARRGRLNEQQQAAYQELIRRRQEKGHPAVGMAEGALTMASGAIAEPVAGFVGLAGLPYGADAAANAVRETQEVLTYQPKTESGREFLGQVGQGMEPMANAIEAISNKLGDATLKYTGSPELAALAYSTPQVAPDLAGLKTANIAGKAGMLGKQYEFANISGQAFGQRGAVGGVELKGGSGNVLGVDDKNRLDRAKNMGFLTDPIFRHDPQYRNVDNDDSPIFEILEGEDTLFDGIFSNEIIGLEESDFLNNDFFVKRRATHNDFNEIFREDLSESMDFLGNELYDYDTLSPEQKETINSLVTEDISNIYDLIEDSSNELPEWMVDLFGESDTGLIEWEIQKIRGRMAKFFGFDAVDMFDETGVSTLLLSTDGTKNVNDSLFKVN